MGDTAANKLLKRNDRKGYVVPNLGGTLGLSPTPGSRAGSTPPERAACLPPGGRPLFAACVAAVTRGVSAYTAQPLPERMLRIGSY